MSTFSKPRAAVKRSLLVRVAGSLIVLSENAATPSDADWDAFMEILTSARPDFERVRILVMTAGGGPSTEQRKRLAVALGGKPVRVAVVTDSMKVRFIVSSIALLNREIASFSNGELDQAYAHLSLTRSEQMQAKSMIAEMAPLVG